MTSRFITQHSYFLLILGSLLDVATTWVALSYLGASEVGIGMVHLIAWLGLPTALMVKMALTAEGGRIMQVYSPGGLKIFAVAIWGVAAFNMVGIYIGIMIMGGMI